MPSVAAARLESGSKVYGSGDAAVRALDGVTVGFAAGSFTAVMGPSGSGKSTLLHCLAGLDTLSSGEAWLGELELGSLKERARTLVRRDRMGFIFQAFNLVPTLTAMENITLPLDLAGTKPDRDWIDSLVATLGIGDRLTHRPAELSGGQQQRVAAARAFAGRPDVVFADEPTGALDSKSGSALLDFMTDAVADLGQTIVMVTHDSGAAGHSERVVFLSDGHLVDEMSDPTAERVLDRLKGLDSDHPPDTPKRRRRARTRPAGTRRAKPLRATT